MIGQEWFYIQQIDATFVIKSAKVIGETPRKWILRETEEIERIEKSNTWTVPAGESRYDWSILKKGEARREGTQRSGKHTHTRVFVEHSYRAEIMISERLAEIWTSKNAYKIAQHLQYQTAKDPALLRKVAELIGWKEEGS